MECRDGSVSMWLTVQGGFTFSLWLASPAGGCPGRTTMTRSWSPSSAGMGMFRERAGGPCRGRGTECGRRQIRESRVAGVEKRPSRRGWGCRGTGCRDGLRSAAGARWWGSGKGLARSGLVHIGRAGGHFEMVRFAVCGLAGRGGCHGVVTSGAKHGGTQGDTLRRFLQVGGGEGRAGTEKHGLSLTGGQVVAGSNPVSPTENPQLDTHV